MPEYRRVYLQGGTYFFTFVTFNRIKIFTSDTVFRMLEDAFKKVMLFHPFTIDAFCVMPDHIHAIWTLPENDFDYSLRIAQMKRYFSKEYSRFMHRPDNLNKSQVERGEAGIWQRRFWEHTIRNFEDLKNHVDYIHFNPVKHGLVSSVKNWPYSSFFQYVDDGLLDREWGGAYNPKLDDNKFGE